MSDKMRLRDDCDTLYAIVIPNLEERHDTYEGRTTEFTTEQARRLNLANLPMMCNHSSEQIGRTVAYRVRDVPKGKPRAEAVFQLMPEPDQPSIDADAQRRAAQRNFLMNGAHRDVSLGHNFYVRYCGNVMAATLPERENGYGAPGINITKRAEEISTCYRGARPGSHILQYLPCKRSLRRSSVDQLRSFTRLYNYPEPPSALERRTPAWEQYVEQLGDQVRQRAHLVLGKNGYGDLLRGRGVVAASEAKKLNFFAGIAWREPPSDAAEAHMPDETARFLYTYACTHSRSAALL